ncbi:MAG TPA: hypothetical protein VFK05_33600 [Polyangiaceae bacterium]|nr:hypothetical protein [Polyangiaceae bacterium]
MLGLGLALTLTSCRREQRAPAPSASVSAAGRDFTLQARERHFQDELTRSNTRFQAKPSLGDCAKALPEKADLSLCQAAESALALLAGPPPATPEAALTRLAASALSLARLADRLRYLSLEELTKQRLVAGDGGVAPKPSASGAVAGALSAVARAQREHGAGHAEHPAVALSEGPVSQLLGVTARLERDVLRNIGAYLEYGPTPVRHAALDTVKGLHAEHPKWPSLEHLLREAAVLEADPELKQALRDLSPSDSPHGPAQSAGTK